MKESYEDIRKILEQFMNTQTAGQMAKDIRQADSLLSAVPAAKTSEETLAAIREKVHCRLAAYRVRNLRIRIEKYVAAVAATILIAVLVGVFFRTHQPTGQNQRPLPLAAASLWNDSFAADNDPVGELTTKVEQLTGQIDTVNQTAIQWLEENSGLTVEIENLEKIALNADFWKG